MAKRINILKAPYNYYWPKVSAVTCIRETGPALVKDEVAADAIARGYAEPFEPAAPVRKPATRRRKAVSKAPDEPATDTRHADRMDRADMAAADRAGGVAPDDDAG